MENCEKYEFKNITSCSCKVVVENHFENYVEKVQNFAHLIYILKVLPVSNAKVERAFSMMTMVKTDWRSSLISAALEHLMQIKIEGPEIDNY